MLDPTPPVHAIGRLLLRLALAAVSASVATSFFVAYQVNGAGTRAAIGKQRVAGREAQTVGYYDHGSGPPVVLCSFGSFYESFMFSAILAHSVQGGVSMNESPRKRCLHGCTR